MKLLLDTHIWIWHLLGSEKLPAQHQELIADKNNELYLSPVSAWEAVMIGEKGKITFHPDPFSWVRSALTREKFTEAPLTHEVAIKSRKIKLPHQDPADRFIVATALVYNLHLLTVDIHLKNFA